eukprot:4187438-Pyramimonas_sp.AAC.1
MAPPIAQLRGRRRPQVRETILAFCAYGTPWRKRACFWHWYVDLSCCGRLCASKAWVLRVFKA